MSGHTKGPWTQYDSHGRRFIEQLGAGEVVAIVCKIPGKDGRDVMSANSSLITAAPKLLEALERVEDGGFQTDHDSDHWGTVRINVNDWKAVQTAIAKAKQVSA